jgi:hypothetical protein
VQQASERSPATLAAKLPPHVLELTALAPSIPVPDPNAKPQAAEKPKRVRSAAHRADWPDEPPPDCGSKHARWRFTDRKAGTKEWYCK